MRVLWALLLASVAWGQTTATWSLQTLPTNRPDYVGWNELILDPYSGKLIIYTTPKTSSTIYGSAFWTYDPAASLESRWAKIPGGYDTVVNTCTFDSPTHPGDRHPYGHFAVDTIGGYLWMGINGANQTCNSRPVNVNSSGVVTVVAGTDMFHSSWIGQQFTIGGTPYTIASVSSPTQMTVSGWSGTASGVTGAYVLPNGGNTIYRCALPFSTGGSPCERINMVNAYGHGTGTWTFDSDNDVIIAFGHRSGSYPVTQVYCPDRGAGSLSANQTSAGCTAFNRWDDSAGPPAATVDDFALFPKGFVQGRIVYAGSGVSYHFGGEAVSTTFSGSPIESNDIWKYTTLTKTWTKLCTSGCTKPTVNAGGVYAAVNQTQFYLVPTTGKLIYHQFSGTGSPKDYVFDPAANSGIGTWTTMTSSGSGPVGAMGTMVYHPGTGKMIEWNFAGSGQMDIWHVTLDAPVSVSGQFRSLGTWPSGNIKWLEVCGLATSLTAGGTASVTLNHASISGGVALTVQEVLASGETGVNRTNEPFCMGVPLQDAYGITTTSGFTLTDTTTTPSDDMATDGTTISVNTGSAACGSPGGICFGVKKANFNVLDTVQVDATTIVATSSSASRGLIITGPAQTGTATQKTTCPDTPDGTCATEFSSARDSASSCSIEQNGPIKSVLKCIGHHKDASGNPYMQFTARLTFLKGKKGVKVTSILRNANYDTTVPSPDNAGSTFNTATKGLESYELRISPSISGTLSYTIGDHDATPTTGNLTSGQSATLYQAKTDRALNDCDTACQDSFTTDTGYTITTPGGTTTGTTTQYAKGWADIRDSSGVGMTIGVYRMAGYWPKSLEFLSGGSDVRIGIWPGASSVAKYIPWVQWSIHDLWLDFHTTTPSTQGAEFLKAQHYLLARASVAHYNATSVFQYPIPDPTVEDDYYAARIAAVSPPVSSSNFCPGGTGPTCRPDIVFDSQRKYVWSAGGGWNQEEFRWQNMLEFLARGHGGKWLAAETIYRMQAESYWPHADGTSSSSSAENGFTWRSRPTLQTQSTAEIDQWSRPYNDTGFTIINESQGFNNYEPDGSHQWWWGMIDYYHMTGDGTVKDSMVLAKDLFLNPYTYVQMWNNTGAIRLEIIRAVATSIIGATKYSEYLQSIGDTDWDEVLSQVAERNYENQFRTDPCVTAGGSNYPAGCTSGTGIGVSRIRGMPITSTSGYHTYCGGGANRGLTNFQASITIESLLFLSKFKGPSWTYYKESRDLAYGIGQWMLAEGFGDDGSTSWNPTGVHYNGFHYSALADYPAKCPDGVTYNSESYDVDGAYFQNAWLGFYALYTVGGRTDWQRQFNIQLDRVAAGDPAAADMGGYQVGTLIHSLNAGAKALQTVSFSVTDLGGGDYQLSFTPPASSTGLRIKWSPKQIRPYGELLGYDGIETTNYTYSPATYSTWFGSNTVTEPSVTPGSAQTVTVSTGTTGLGTANFSVLAFADAGSVPSSGSQMGGQVRVGGKATF